MVCVQRQRHRGLRGEGRGGGDKFESKKSGQEVQSFENRHIIAKL